MLLGDLGADVIKIEPPEGDVDARLGAAVGRPGRRPTGRGRLPTTWRSTATSAALRLDLKTAEGAEILRRLLADADVLVENLRVGAFARLGFDDATLAALNPRLVHLAITGYGTTVPPPTGPATTSSIQATSGLMSITGAPDADGGGPTKVGVAISDVVTGMLGAVGVLAALVGRERDGRAGRRVAASASTCRSSGATLASLVNQAQNAFVSGVAPGRLGNAHPNIVPYETFDDGRRRDRDRGRVRAPVAAVLRARSGCPSSPSDPRFATNGDRVERRAELRADRWPRGSPSAASADWLRPSRRPRSRPGRSTTSPPPSRRPRPSRSG